jgi:hypothetical protein
MPGNDESRRTPLHAGPDPITATILADRRRRARSRIRAQNEHRRVCRELEQLASLVEFYEQPKGAFYCSIVEGWTWAA